MINTEVHLALLKIPLVSFIVWCDILSLFILSFITDPTVSRYHVQWMPEYCSHNETRGPEKSVTRVSLRQPPHTPSDCRSDHRVTKRSAAPSYAKHAQNLLSDAQNGRRRERKPLRWVTLKPPSRRICTGQIPGWCCEYYESVAWSGHVVRWPIKQCFPEEEEEEEEEFPSHALCMGLFLVACSRDCVGVGRVCGVCVWGGD